MEFNLSPETLVDERHPTVTVEKILNQELTFEKYKDYAVCPNGAMYRKDVKGFLPELMEKMYNDRVVYKEKMITAKKELEQIESEMKKRKLL
jgi:DNA polymerase elongation subunit (family B)